MIEVFDRTFTADGLQRGVRLTNAEFMAQPVFRERWTRLRIGFQVTLNDYGNTSTINGILMLVGLTTNFNPYSSPDPNLTNWVGMNCFATPPTVTSADLTYNAGSGNPYYSYAAQRGSFGYRRGYDFIYSQQWVNGGLPYWPNALGARARRGYYCFEIWKDRPDIGYTVHWECSYTAAQGQQDCTNIQFVELFEATVASAPTPFGVITNSSGIQFVGPNEQGYGVFDTVDVVWGSNSVGLEIFNLSLLRYQ